MKNFKSSFAVDFSFKDAFFSTNDYRVRQRLIDLVTEKKKEINFPDEKFWIEEVWELIKKEK